MFMTDLGHQLAKCSSATVTWVVFLGGKKCHGLVLVNYGLEGSDTVFISNLLWKFREEFAA